MLKNAGDTRRFRLRLKATVTVALLTSVFISSGFLVHSAHAQGAWVALNPEGGYCNPLVKSGLSSYASSFGDDSMGSLQMVKEAAVYAGSGIEPMAFAACHVSCDQQSAHGWDGASAEIDWPYLIFDKATGKPLDPYTYYSSIPMDLKYSMDLSPSGYSALAIGVAGILNGPFAQRTEGAGNRAGETAGSPAAGTLSYNYQGYGGSLSVRAEAAAYADIWVISGPTSSECQAVITDPYLFIDPSSPLASQMEVYVAKTANASVDDPSAWTPSVPTTVDLNSIVPLSLSNQTAPPSPSPTASPSPTLTVSPSPSLAASTINVMHPCYMAYDSGKGEIFVTDSWDSCVYVISDTTNTVVATVNDVPNPNDIVYDFGRGEMFVTNNGGTVSVISDSTNTVVATVPVGAQPMGIAYDSGKGEVFVANSMNDSVSVISDSTNTVVATVDMGTTSIMGIPFSNHPWGIAYDSGKGEVFVTNSGENSVSVISDSTNQVVGKPFSIEAAGSGAEHAAYDSGKGEVFVTNYQLGNSVAVISDSTKTLVATVHVGSFPDGVAYDSGKGEVFVTNSGENSVSVISDSTNQVVATVPVGSSPMGVAYDSGMGEIFVANFRNGTISVIPDSSITLQPASPSSSSASASPSPTVPEFSSAGGSANPLAIDFTSISFILIVVAVAAVTISAVALVARKMARTRSVSKLDNQVARALLCPKCGKKLPKPNAKFCPFCGEALKTGE